MIVLRRDASPYPFCLASMLLRPVELWPVKMLVASQANLWLDVQRLQLFQLLLSVQLRGAVLLTRGTS